MRLLVFGPGYSASAAIARLRNRAVWIGATARDDAAAAVLQAAGIEPLAFAGETPSSAAQAALKRATHILVSIPPGESGDPVLRHHADDIAVAPDLVSLVYLSTVGVYGDHAGGWVDEDTPPRPVSRRSVERRAAEQAWRDVASRAKTPLAILRLAGIYGPGRNALENLRDGSARRIVKPGQVFNRIHVEDIAAAVAAAFARRAGGVFNVSDDEPAPPQDVVAFGAGLLGVPPPPEIPFEAADLSPMGRSFYGENKRVANLRLKRDLAVRLRYPTYREGLTALADAPAAPSNAAM